MTTLAEEGFLADEAGAVVAAMRAKYAPWLAEVRTLNGLLVRMQYELSVHPESTQEMACAALFVRTLSHSQASILLLERGMIASAKAMSRCALEGLFNLGACSRDHKTALAFVDANEVGRKNWAKRLGQVQDSAVRANVDVMELQEILAQAERKIEEFGARDLKARDMAKLADLEICT